MPNPKALHERKNRLVRQLQALGYQMQLTVGPLPATA